MTRLIATLAVCLGLFLLATRDDHAVGVLEEYFELGEEYAVGDSEGWPVAYASRTDACTYAKDGSDPYCWEFPSVRYATWDECYYAEWAKVETQAWLNSILNRRLAVRVECVAEYDA